MSIVYHKEVSVHYHPSLVSYTKKTIHVVHMVFTPKLIIAHSGVILELSEREKFCDNFREKFGSKFWISIYILHISPQLKIGRSQPA